VGRRRQLLSVTLDLDEVKAIAKRYDATINDLVLTLVASGLRALFRGRRDHPRAVRALVPVSLRPPGGGRSTGNEVAAVIVELPLAMANPVAVLGAIQAETRRLKGSADVDAMARALSSADTWPPAALGVIGPFVRHQPLVNLVVTNVRGPAGRLELLGAEIEQIVPIVPLGPNLTCGVAVLSYSGQLVLGVHVDPDHVPDAHRLVEGMQQALGRLRRAS
jgi:diacylglycerol O-acyltransferase